MAYLTTFYWGWLLASALLGLAMGWISVVQRGEGVSKHLARWLAALAAALVAAALARVVPGRFGYWLDLGLIMFALYLAAARSDHGCATGWSRAARRTAVTGSMARPSFDRRHCTGALTDPVEGLRGSRTVAGAECSKTVHPLS